MKVCNPNNHYKIRLEYVALTCTYCGNDYPTSEFNTKTWQCNYCQDHDGKRDADNIKKQEAKDNFERLKDLIVPTVTHKVRDNHGVSCGSY